MYDNKGLERRRLTSGEEGGELGGGVTEACLTAVSTLTGLRSKGWGKGNLAVEDVATTHRRF